MKRLGAALLRLFALLLVVPAFPLFALGTLLVGPYGQPSEAFDFGDSLVGLYFSAAAVGLLAIVAIPAFAIFLPLYGIATGTTWVIKGKPLGWLA